MLFRSRQSMLVVATSLLVIAVGVFGLDSRFLPAASEEDGFQSQLFAVALGFEEGDLFERIAANWLLLVHLLRGLAVLPFLLVESALGSVGLLAFVMLVLIRLITIPYASSKSLLVFLPLAMPLVLSGRSVLVSAGVAYIALYLLSDRGRPWMLWLGALWVNLSSASVLMALLLLLFAKPRVPAAERQRVQRAVVLLVLAVSLVISAVDKLGGFQAGDVGYESLAGDSESLLVTVLSRATLIVSFAEGQVLRALVYSILALFLAIRLATLPLGPGTRGTRRLLLCCVPGVLLEGLGVVGLVFPLVWMVAGFSPTARSATPARTARSASRARWARGPIPGPKPPSAIQGPAR